MTDLEWYKKYEAYTKEPVVRKRHDSMFNFLFNFSSPYGPDVVDLGCATMEYYRYGQWNRYFGIDKRYILEDREILGTYGEIYKPVAKIGDYTTETINTFCPFFPDAFISLFSTEIFMTAAEKYKFYEKTFLDNPSLTVGMVAGCYYKNFEECDIYTESDGSVIYQTIEPQTKFISKIFDECRIYLNAPSEMFGDNVVEVWKFFHRRFT